MPPERFAEMGGICFYSHTFVQAGHVVRVCSFGGFRFGFGFIFPNLSLRFLLVLI
jgi:hypothetical protein